MTLIETCASVAILGTVAIIGAPTVIRAREIYHLEAAARQVASHLQLARIKAVSGNRDCRVRVTSEVTYAIECEDASWLIEESLVLPSGFRITANAAPAFHERGNVSPTATISVWDNRLRSRRVIVNITGRVRVE